MNSTQRGLSVPVLEIAGLAMILIAAGLLLLQLSGFSAERQRLPSGVTLGEVSVGDLSRTEAQARVEQIYGAPVLVSYQDSEILLEPDEVDLVVRSDAMLDRADAARTEGTFWGGFWNHLWARSEEAYSVDADISYSDDRLQAWLEDVAARYDRPPQPATTNVSTLMVEAGEPGYTLDIEASLPLIDEALRDPINRQVTLVINRQEAPDPGMEELRALVLEYLISENFSRVATIHAIDLETGDEMHLNLDFRTGSPVDPGCDIAYAGMSMMKIGVMVDFFRLLDWNPTEGSDDYKNLIETMSLSGNASANVMLGKIGYGSSTPDDFGAAEYRRGADIVTRNLWSLGLENTFMASFYDDEELPEYYSTPAREAARGGACINTLPDPYMQTTATDMASLLDMVYQCATFNGGALIARFPDDITQDDCVQMIGLLEQNDEGVLIMAGVPSDVEVAHKHGWIADTHGDAGIVRSPGGDYVLVMFIWGDQNWLPAQESFPIMMGISEITFNYFNPDLIDVPRQGLLDLQDAPAQPVPGSDDP
ncbi:MAG: class A beta-lactamase-related serine hydrolase [Chloroflexi bacterium]|nr:class A beta-lactamase-related serine hydrolase [Chloroflexota bacterium]